MRSLSFGSALQELAGLLTRLQIAQRAPSSVDEDDPDRLRLLQLSHRFSPEFVQLAYQIMLHGRSELGLAPDEYSGFVMTLLRLHGFRPETVADAVSAAQSSRPQGGPNSPPPVDPAPLRAVQAPDPARVPVVDSVAVPAPQGDWAAIMPALGLNGLARALAQHCELVRLEENVCELRLAPEHAHLQMKPAPERLQQALRDHLGRPVLLKIELAQTGVETLAASAEREKQERQARAIAAIEKDAFVRDVIEGFDASLVESSIKPIA